MCRIRRIVRCNNFNITKYLFVTELIAYHPITYIFIEVTFCFQYFCEYRPYRFTTIEIM